MSNKKLFGKVNVVDIVVVLIIIAAGVFFAVRYLGVGRGETGAVVEVSYEVTVEAVSVELYEEILKQLPGQMMASGSLVSGQVLSVTAAPCVVESYESKNPYDSNVTYTVYPEEGEEFVKIVFGCTATVQRSSLLNELATQELRLGRAHIVKTQKLEIVGIITSLTMNDSLA